MFQLRKIQGLRISRKPLFSLLVVPRVFLIYSNCRILLKGGHNYLEIVLKIPTITNECDQPPFLSCLSDPPAPKN
jgi:hypothetical protein